MANTVPYYWGPLLVTWSSDWSSAGRFFPGSPRLPSPVSARLKAKGFLNASPANAEDVTGPRQCADRGQLPFTRLIFWLPAANSTFSSALRASDKFETVDGLGAESLPRQITRPSADGPAGGRVAAAGAARESSLAWY